MEKKMTMKKLSKQILFFIALCGIAVWNIAMAGEPKPVEPIPSEAQLRWHETEIFALVCHGLNPYTNKEWNDGSDSPQIFNPKNFDAEQIVSAIQRGGVNGVVLVAKHHDGFCLWNTKTTDYNISKTPYKNGKGDIVKELADASRKHGLKFGLYCSPWDRNTAKYGTPDYIPMYREQLRELLTNYGELFEIWFDGANGGDGYYGGARGKRIVDKTVYYDWQNTFDLVRRLQPKACMFSDIGPDLRWVGNEQGYAAKESWATFTPRGGSNPNKPAIGDANTNEAAAGHRNGKYWMPTECDFPLRRGWFWHANEDPTVRQPDKLLDIYFNSVGKGGGMNIGIAPNADGVVCDADIKSLDVFGQKLRNLFAKNLAADAAITADNERKKENNLSFAASNVLDADRYSYWATEDNITTATLMLTLPEPKEFNVVRLRENIKLGHRIGSFAIDISQDGQWKEIAKGQSIGACRLLKTNKVKTDKVRLRILESRACPCISDFGLFILP
jgi:alpha-L-fucosidase